MHLYLLSITVFPITRASQFPFWGLNHLDLFSLISRCVLTHTLTLALLTWFFLMYCWTACKPLPRSVCMASGSRSWTHAWGGYREQVKGRMHLRTPASQFNWKPPAQYLRPFLNKESWSHLRPLLLTCSALLSACTQARFVLTSVLCTGTSCFLEFPSCSLSGLTGTLPSCLHSDIPSSRKSSLTLDLGQLPPNFLITALITLDCHCLERALSPRTTPWTLEPSMGRNGVRLGHPRDCIIIQAQSWVHSDQVNEQMRE